MPVRDAEPQDIEAICSLIEEHARHEGNNELQLDRADMSRHLFDPDPKAWVLMAEYDGEIAGMALCSWLFWSWDACPGIWLDDIYIRPEYRRHGIGRELLGELRNRTSGRIAWDVREGNDAAEAFYTRLGARPVQGWVRYSWQG